MTLSPTSTMNASAVSPKTLGLPSLAFVGKAGAGKTTAAEMLVELGYRRLSFADPLKNIAAMLWGQDIGRDKLQRLGVAVREIQADTWVDLLRARFVEHNLLLQDRFVEHNLDRPAAIDDCRFENEWHALKAEGFVIVRVVAERARRIDRLKANGKWQDEEQLDHISETAIDHLLEDYTLGNDDTVDEFYEDLVDIVIRERRRR